MNLKMPFVIRASVVLALSLPLAGCGNKGPLVLPQNPPPTEMGALPVMPPPDDATVPAEVPPPASDDGNG